MSTSELDIEVQTQTIDDVVRRARNCELQLPDFQRDFVWKKERGRELVRSILLGLPIGSLIVLKKGKLSAVLNPLPVKGVASPNMVNGVPIAQIIPDLLLDGQQRVTTLCGVFSIHGVEFASGKKAAPVTTHMFIDIEKLHEAEASPLTGSDIHDMVDAAVVCAKVCPPHKSSKNNPNPLPRTVVTVRDVNGSSRSLDLTSTEEQGKHGYLPLHLVLSADRDAWEDAYAVHHPDPSPYKSLRNLLRRVGGYKIPVTYLGDRTNADDVSATYTNLNNQGLRLSVINLMDSALFRAGGNISVSKDWKEMAKGFVTNNVASLITANGGGEPESQSIIREEHYVQAATMLYYAHESLCGSWNANALSTEIGATKSLEIKPEGYRLIRDNLAKGFTWVGETFLPNQGITKGTSLPYPGLAVVMAVVHALFSFKSATTPGTPHKVEAVTSETILEKWFWRTAISSYYQQGSASKMKEDVPLLYRLVDGIPAPHNGAAVAYQPEIRNRKTFNITPTTLDGCTSITSALHKSVIALIQKSEPQDFWSQSKVKGDKVDIHHIFPKAYMEKSRKGTYAAGAPDYDSVVNKTPILGESNRAVSDKSPKDYLAQDIKPNNPAYASMLQEHLIVESQMGEAKDFAAFYETRRDALLEMLRAAYDY